MFRILSFRANRDEIEDSGWTLVIVALAVTWIVGIGRWWDDPREISPIARVGLGSVVYVFALSLFIWIVAWPLMDEKVSYRTMLASIASTALPGILYALPAERISGMEAASSYNMSALLFVSAFRVALLIWILRKIIELEWVEVIIAWLLPLSAILLTITSLGHGARILDIMGGLRDRMSKTEMETIVGLFGLLSWIVGPLTLLAFLALAASKMVENRRK